MTKSGFDHIHNSHAGELLVSEFLVPGLADLIGFDQGELRAVVAGDERISTELDELLCKHFCMSNGFFLRLQNDYEAVEAKHNQEQAA